MVILFSLRKLILSLLDHKSLMVTVPLMSRYLSYDMKALTLNTSPNNFLFLRLSSEVNPNLTKVDPLPWISFMISSNLFSLCIFGLHEFLSLSMDLEVSCLGLFSGI